MAESAIKGTDWDETEVEACVSEYFKLLEATLRGQTPNKQQIYRQLAEKSGRSPSSIEFKFQNISAILNVLGREWIKGLAPLANYQKLLAEKVSAHITRIDLLQLPIASENYLLKEPAAFHLEAPPELLGNGRPLPDYISDLIRKFDPVEKDMRNRELGNAGEQFVLFHEKRFLELIGRPDLSKNVRWISKEEGDGAGYDILSYTDRGDVRHVEVKTTNGGNRTPFFLTRNELRFCKQHLDTYGLVRLYDFRRNARGFELPGDIERHVHLSADTYSAGFEGPVVGGTEAIG